MATSFEFKLLALAIMGRAEVSDSSDFKMAFGACFGMSPNLYVRVWDEIEDVLPSAAMIPHLLWVLLFLKVYGTEDTMAVMVQTTQKTYRKWVGIVIEEIYSLTYVSWLHCLFV